MFEICEIFKIFGGLGVGIAEGRCRAKNKVRVGEVGGGDKGE